MYKTCDSLLTRKSERTLSTRHPLEHQTESSPWNSQRKTVHLSGDWKDHWTKWYPVHRANSLEEMWPPGMAWTLWPIQPLLLIEWNPGDPERSLISGFWGEVCMKGPRTFLMTSIVSCWPGDTSCPSAGNPIVMPCAAAAAAQMEATRMDNNFILREKTVSGVSGRGFCLFSLQMPYIYGCSSRATFFFR